MNKYKFFLNSILNEISIEEDILKRINRQNIAYVPTRTIKLLPLLDKYKVGKYFYLIINYIYLIVAPFFYFYKLLKWLKPNKELTIDSCLKIKKKVILLSTSRAYPLSKKIFNSEDILYIDINQNTILSESNYLHIKSILGYLDYFKAFFFSVIGLFYVLIHLKDKSSLLQTYVAYDWFLIFIALNKIKPQVDEVIFANHYDRWATMFDQLFESKKIVLIQHGILSKSLRLKYKLKNLDVIYRFNQQSEDLFKTFFISDNIYFKTLDTSIILQTINSAVKSILIIGQPHSIRQEIEIILDLIRNSDYDIYIKPHPLFATIEYESIEGVNLIRDKTFFPKVDLALSYESTLGLEYENSGVKVLWYKKLNKSQLINEIRQIFEEK